MSDLPWLFQMKKVTWQVEDILSVEDATELNKTMFGQDILSCLEMENLRSEGVMRKWMCSDSGAVM